MQHGAAMAALRTYEQGPDPHLLSELVEELQARGKDMAQRRSPNCKSPGENKIMIGHGPIE